MQHCPPWIFCKERGGKGGQGAFALQIIDGQFTKDGQRLSQSEVAELFKSPSDILVQSRIRQSDQMSLLNASSINTVRIITLFGRDDTEARTFGAALRIGRSGSVVDNAAAGGLFAEVDVAKGQLKGALKDKKGVSYTSSVPEPQHATRPEAPCDPRRSRRCRRKARSGSI